MEHKINDIIIRELINASKYRSLSTIIYHYINIQDDYFRNNNNLTAIEQLKYINKYYQAKDKLQLEKVNQVNNLMKKKLKQVFNKYTFNEFVYLIKDDKNLKPNINNLRFFLLFKHLL